MSFFIWQVSDDQLESSDRIQVASSYLGPSYWCYRSIRRCQLSYALSRSELSWYNIVLPASTQNEFLVRYEVLRPSSSPFAACLSWNEDGIHKIPNDISSCIRAFLGRITAPLLNQSILSLIDVRKNRTNGIEGGCDAVAIILVMYVVCSYVEYTHQG